MRIPLLLIAALAMTACTKPPPMPETDRVADAITVLENETDNPGKTSTSALAEAIRVLAANSAELDNRPDMLDRLAIITNDANASGRARAAAGHCLASLARKYPELYAGAPAGD